MLNSIPYYGKIIFLCFIIKRDDVMLKKFDLTDDFIKNIYIDCKQIMMIDMDQYFSHIKNLEETVLENISY